MDIKRILVFFLLMVGVYLPNIDEAKSNNDSLENEDSRRLVTFIDRGLTMLCAQQSPGSKFDLKTGECVVDPMLLRGPYDKDGWP